MNKNEEITWGIQYNTRGHNPSLKIDEFNISREKFVELYNKAIGMIECDLLDDYEVCIRLFKNCSENDYGDEFKVIDDFGLEGSYPYEKNHLNKLTS